MDVSCYNEPHVDYITHAILGCVKSAVDGNPAWNSQQMNQFYRRFTEVFEETVKENIKFDTSSEDDDEINQAHKKYSEHRKRILNKVILPQLDTTLLHTTRKRKNYPRKSTLYHARMYKEKIKYLEKVDWKVENAGEDEALKPVTVINDDSTQNVSDMAKTVYKHLKTGPELLESVEDVKRGLHLINTGLITETDKVLFDTDDDTL